MKGDKYTVTIERNQFKTSLVVYRNKKPMCKFNVSGRPYNEQARLQSLLSEMLFELSQ